jgi:hypothetical protein
MLNMLDLDSSDYPFESAALLREQFFADRLNVGDPIERLMFAILDDAIRCYQTNVGVQRPQARGALAETEEWLFGLPVMSPSQSRVYATPCKSTRRGYSAHFDNGEIGNWQDVVFRA